MIEAAGQRRALKVIAAVAQHPFMPFFPEKFFADTADVSPDAAAFYMVLLAHAWARGGSLPNDSNKLRLMTRLSGNRWRAIRDEILRYWMVGEDGRLHQKRLDLEWERALVWHRKRKQGATAKVGEATQKVNEHSGKKPRKINGTNDQSRARPRTPTPQKDSLSYDRENLSGAPASLSVRAHASPDALGPVGETEPSPPMDDAVRARIAEDLHKLAASISNPDRLTEPAAGSIAELERQAAAAKLAEWAASSALPALSPAALATPRLAKANGHALPKALPAPIKQKRRTAAKVH